MATRRPLVIVSGVTQQLPAADTLDVLIASGFINGLILANNASDATNDIDFGTGVAWIGDRLVQNSSTITKRLDASWSANSGSGGLFSGAKANSTWYHCHALRNDSTGAVDFGFDTSATAANKPSGWTARRIGAIVTDGSGTIRGFKQYGDRFEWTTPIKDLQQAGISSSGELLTLTVPTGVQVQTLATAYWTGSSGNFLYFSSPDSTNLSADATEGRLHIQNNSIDQTGALNYTTNTSGQVRARSSASNVADTLRILTYGWIDPRGQN